MESEHQNHKKEEQSNKQIVIANPQRDLHADRVLSDEDMKFFDDNGYVIVRNAVPEELCDAVVKAIWNFLKMSPKYVIFDLSQCTGDYIGDSVAILL
jgi:hypothetical protein